MQESSFVLFGQSISSVLQFQQLGGFKSRSVPFQVGFIHVQIHVYLIYEIMFIHMSVVSTRFETKECSDNLVVNAQ